MLGAAAVDGGEMRLLARLDSGLVLERQWRFPLRQDNAWCGNLHVDFSLSAAETLALMAMLMKNDWDTAHSIYCALRYTPERAQKGK